MIILLVLLADNIGECCCPNSEVVCLNTLVLHVFFVDIVGATVIYSQRWLLGPLAVAGHVLTRFRGFTFDILLALRIECV